jgi:putative ABC transport system permease protein
MINYFRGTYLLFKLLGESFSFAYASVKTNKLRTFLSLLGVSIGIFAIISVFTVVDALELNIREGVNALGSNVVYIEKWPWTNEGGENKWWEFRQRPENKYTEYVHVRANSKLAEEVAMYIYFTREVKYKSNTTSRIGIVGITYEWNDVNFVDISLGRYFSTLEANNGASVAIVGREIANELFDNEDPIGKEIKIGGYKARIVGVVKKQGSSILNLMDYDNTVVIPLNYARTMVDIRRSSPSIAVKAKEEVEVEEMKSELRMFMRSLRRLPPSQKDNFSLNEVSVLNNELAGMFDVLNIAGILIGGFSILIGGFGIANIMFVSVKERTNIIGIQKALGAKNYFILTQFLFEATWLSIVGGVLGLLVVYAGSALVSAGLDFSINLTVGNILRGILISGVIGIVSGFVPAYTASRLNPVDAINSK